MNRPDNLMAYDELDLKLGIKSSLPHVKGTLRLYGTNNFMRSIMC